MSSLKIMDFSVHFFLVYLCVLVCVAFLTLLERKILSLSQNRLGPNKVGFLGILQPFADGLKLFSKEEVFVWFSNKFMFIFFPFFSFFISGVVWCMLFSFSGFLSLKLSFLVFLFCVSIGVYGIIFTGWASNSKYGILGGLRAVAQTVSYELVLSFMVFLISLVFFTFCFMDVFYMNKLSFMVFVLPILGFLIFIVCVVETNRAPFDLAEGESELVSGFNIEFGGFKFSLIFLGEYSIILWMCLFNTLVFWGFYILVFLFYVFFYLWFRAAYPRFRYDYLMMLLWKSYLGTLLFLFVWLLL